MGRYFVSRPVFFFIIGLLLLGGIFMKLPAGLPLGVSKSDTDSSLWGQLTNQSNHSLLLLQDHISSWDNRALHFSATGSVIIMSGLQHTITHQIIVPPLHGSVALDHYIHVSNHLASGHIIGTGVFSLASGVVTSLSGLVTSGGTTDDYLIDVALDVHFLRSGTQSRRYLNDLTVTQSGYWYELPTLTRAYLQEYEKSRVSYELLPEWIQRLLTFSVYSTLEQQTDQHVIQTASGTTQLLVQGNTIGIDATIDNQGQFIGLLKFPQSGLRWDIKQLNNSNEYGFQLHEYRITEPLLQGVHTLNIQRTRLFASGIRSGSQKDTWLRSGAYSFSAASIAPFSFTPPLQYRERKDIAH